jgi:hypothetical protein
MNYGVGCVNGDLMVVSTSQLSRIEALIAQDRMFLFTLSSYVLVLSIYVNLNVFQSAVLGSVISVLYFIVNGVFLGHAFFEKEAAFFRLMFGILLLVMLLGFGGWLAIMIYNLDVPWFILVLFGSATLSSLLNRRVKSKSAA